MRPLASAIKTIDWQTFFRSVVKGVGGALGSIVVYGLVMWLIYRKMRKTDVGASVTDALGTTMRLRSQGMGVLGTSVNNTVDANKPNGF